jgi:hypothetical protein
LARNPEGGQAVKRYLLVEDNDDHAELVVRGIMQPGNDREIERVRDGVAALAYLRRQSPYELATRPDVILLDVKLPKLDGHQVLAAIKRDAELRRIPVVILTTSDSEVDRGLAYDNWVNSYLVKPVDFRQFRQMITDMDAYWSDWNRSAI